MPPRPRAPPAHARDAARSHPLMQLPRSNNPPRRVPSAKTHAAAHSPTRRAARGRWKRYAGCGEAWGRSSPASSGFSCCGFGWMVGTTEDVRSRGVLEGRRVMPDSVELVLLLGVEFRAREGWRCGGAEVERYSIFRIEEARCRDAQAYFLRVERW